MRIQVKVGRGVGLFAAALFFGRRVDAGLRADRGHSSRAFRLFPQTTQSNPVPTRFRFKAAFPKATVGVFLQFLPFRLFSADRVRWTITVSGDLAAGAGCRDRFQYRRHQRSPNPGRPIYASNQASEKAPSGPRFRAISTSRCYPSSDRKRWRRSLLPKSHRQRDIQFSRCGKCVFSGRDRRHREIQFHRYGRRTWMRACDNESIHLTDTVIGLGLCGRCRQRENHSYR